MPHLLYVGLDLPSFVDEDADGRVDKVLLEKALQKYAKRPLKIGSFSAASNVTGIGSDTAGIAILLHKYGALSFWDFAAAGPYVNFRGDTARVLEHTARTVAAGSLLSPPAGQPRVMIEFSQPNTHKLFHVGHLRNVVLGDALVRAFRARGHDVVAANYYGDFGIDVAKCLWWIPTRPEETVPVEHRIAWLGSCYVRATQLVAELEASDPEKATTTKASTGSGVRRSGTSSSSSRTSRRARR